MKRISYSLTLLLCLVLSPIRSQEFKTPVKEFMVESQAVITLTASHAEIEIEEWNKNKVEVQGIMNIQGLSEKEARKLFDNWTIDTEVNKKEVAINSKSMRFGDEFFFIHNDKYLGNVMVDIPKLTGGIIESLDSMHFELPEIAEFPDVNFDYNFNFDGEAMAFDYEAFKEDSEYLKEWQEKNKDQLKKLKEELQKNEKRYAEQHKEMEKRVQEAQRRYEEQHAKKAEKMALEAQKQAEIMEKKMREREHEIQRIVEERQKVKVKRILKIKVPKNARLIMDVDYCKITTI